MSCHILISSTSDLELKAAQTTSALNRELTRVKLQLDGFRKEQDALIKINEQFVAENAQLRASLMSKQETERALQEAREEGPRSWPTGPVELCLTIDVSYQSTVPFRPKYGEAAGSGVTVCFS